MSGSGFDLGLFDPARANVHVMPCGDLALLGMSARDAGLRTIEVDLAHCIDKPMLLSRLAIALDVPDGSGRNWDALSDLLRDLGWLETQKGNALLLPSAGDLRDAAPGDYETLLSILHEAAQYWAGTDTPFWAFVGLPDQEFAWPEGKEPEAFTSQD